MIQGFTRAESKLKNDYAIRSLLGGAMKQLIKLITAMSFVVFSGHAFSESIKIV